MSEDVPQTKALQWGKDILVILVIPALLWIVKLETGNAQRDLIIQQAQSEVARLEVRFSEIAEIDDRVQQNALHLARLEGKIDTANGRLDEIRSILLER
jgi:hypothetical protein